MLATLFLAEQVLLFDGVLGMVAWVSLVGDQVGQVGEPAG
jgi:hypothetical protein